MGILLLQGCKKHQEIQLRFKSISNRKFHKIFSLFMWNVFPYDHFARYFFRKIIKTIKRSMKSTLLYELFKLNKIMQSSIKITFAFYDYCCWVQILSFFSNFEVLVYHIKHKHIGPCLNYNPKGKMWKLEN